MDIEFSYDEEFNQLLERLFNKYPDEIKEIEGLGEDLDLNKFAKDFFKSDETVDATIDENANVTDNSVIAYTIESKKPMARLNSYYVLWKELKNLYGLKEANDIIEAQYSGEIYVNDFHGIGSGRPYCFNYSVQDIAVEGLPMIEKIESKPPKHLYALKSQVEQFTVIAANSTLGATGLADLLVVMAGYVDKALKEKSDAHFNFESKEDVWTYAKETITSLIYTVNQPMRTGLQSPFTNVSVYDDNFLENMIDDYINPVTMETPKKETVKKLQEIFIDAMNETLERTPATFPVTTACFSVDDDNNIQDKDFLEMISKKNLKYGFINIYIGKTSTLSSCCRLRSEADNEYFNSFGSGSTKIGSLGVCTVNLPRLAFEATRGETAFFDKLEKMIEYSNKVNYAKRLFIQDKIERGNHPLYSLGFLDINKQYHTVGINGFNEAIEIMGKDILTNSGQDLGLDIIEMINDQNDKWSEKLNVPTNAEQIPAESTSVKLCRKDKLLGYNSRYNLYSNQFIPLTTQADLLDRIKLQGVFDKHFSGGAIAHLNVEEKIEDWTKMANLIEHSANQGVVYFAVNYNLQQCQNGHMTVGKKDNCKICGSKITDNYTRVVGFLTNTKHWNKTRRQVDYPNRDFYDDIE